MRALKLPSQSSPAAGTDQPVAFEWEAVIDGRGSWSDCTRGLSRSLVPAPVCRRGRLSFAYVCDTLLSVLVPKVSDLTRPQPCTARLGSQERHLLHWRSPSARWLGPAQYRDRLPSETLQAPSSTAWYSALQLIKRQRGDHTALSSWHRSLIEPNVGEV